MNKHIWVYLILFLSLMVTVSAVTINSVSVSDPDVFYSNYEGNKIINLVVNVTGANESSAVAVTANIIGLENNGVSPCPIINLINSNGNLWTGSCDVGAAAGALGKNTFKRGTVSITANETYGPSSINSNLTIAIYNIDLANLIVPSNACYKFGAGSTNLNQKVNLNNFNIDLVILADDDSSCISQGYRWNNDLTVAELTFNGVNLNNNVADAEKLTQLYDLVKFKFSSAGTYQNHKLTINTTYLPAIDVDLLTVKLYHLSVIAPTNEFVVSDNSVQAGTISWVSNGFDGVLQNNTYNLIFAANKGYKGFTITDNILPSIISYSPSINQAFNTTNVTFNALVNGTGTAVSKVLFIVNCVSNNATCIALNAEVYNCSLALTQSDGVYNLSIAAYDFGGDSGNVKIINLSYFIQTSPPVITPITPTSGATYTSIAGSMMKLKFNATDGNGLNSCSYSLTGPITINNTNISCLQNTSTQLYLSSGAYTLILSSTDTTGMSSTSNISFTVTDTTAPVMTNTTSMPNSSDAILSVNTDESATCKYDTYDTSYSDMRKTFTNNVSKHTATLDLDRDKVYDYYIRCLDLSNNANKESLHIRLVYGTAPVENKTVIKGDPTFTSDLGTVPAGTKVVGIDKAGIPILNMIITTTKLATDVNLKITAVSKPEEIYSEKVYKYITIEHVALSDDDISDVKIKFSVDKKWLTDNSINNSDVILVRYGADGWSVLNTTLTRDDDSEILYLADSPGLSLFAISKRVPAPVAAPVVLLAATDNQTNVPENVTSQNTELLKKRDINWFWVIVLSIIVFVAIVLFILVQKNDKDNPPIFPEDRTFFGRIRRLFK